MTESATTQPVAHAPVWDMPRINTGKNTPGGGGALGAAAALGDVVLAACATKGAFDGRKVGKAFRQAMEAAA